ncbi:hypothetical protein B0T26DRAFT_715309, partial [Lasiosphaeria miniovina]
MHYLRQLAIGIALFAVLCRAALAAADSVLAGNARQQLEARTGGRTVIGGHGVVVIPNNGQGIEQAGGEVRIVDIGGATVQVIAGADVTVNGEPILADVDDENRDSGPGVMVDAPNQPLSAGQAAAIAFAMAAEELKAESRLDESAGEDRSG